MKTPNDSVFQVSLTEITFTIILLLVLLLGIPLAFAQKLANDLEAQNSDLNAQIKDKDKDIGELEQKVQEFSRLNEQLGGICKPDPGDPIEPMMPCAKCVSVVGKVTKDEASKAIDLGKKVVELWKANPNIPFEDFKKNMMYAARDLAAGKALVPTDPSVKTGVAKAAEQISQGKELLPSDVVDERVKQACGDANQVSQMLNDLRKESQEKDQQLRDMGKELQIQKDTNKYFAKRAGMDYPPCWTTNGKTQYLFSIDILPNDKLIVQKAWPKEREQEALNMPPVKRFLPLLGSEITMNTFRPYANEILKISNLNIVDSTRPEACRHFVILRSFIPDRPTADRQRLKLENYFYKYEVLRDE